MLDDLRFALRALLRRSGTSLAAVATLTLAIGASVAVLSVLQGVVLSPLPYPEPERLVHIQRYDAVLRGPVAPLWGVEGLAPHVYVATAAVLVVVAFAATVLPARRAARMAPMQAVRQG